MFSWICPTCGRDVPPSQTDCPHCAERAREAAAAAAMAPPMAPPQAGPWQQPMPPQGLAPQPPAWQQAPPPPPAPPQQPPPAWQQVAAPPPVPPPPQQYAQQPQYAPPPPQPQYAPPPPPPQYPPQYAQQPPAAWAPQPERTGPPMWLMIAGSAVAFLVLIGAIYWAVQHFGSTSPAEKAGLENPANASKQKVSNPLQKYVEVVGIRMITEKQKPVARFVVVNHSGADIANLEANVTLWASTSRSEEDSVGSFTFRIDNLGANDSKELTEALKTKLKMYELPDWQNATAEIQITSPPAESQQ